MRLGLPSIQLKAWGPLLGLSLLAAAANQAGLQVFYGGPLFFGSALVVLALLLFGNRGALVGLASVLLAPRLWLEPQAAIVLLAELLWFTLYLGTAPDVQRRRERGGIVMAAIIFWILVAIPLNLLLFGLIANVDLASVLHLSLLQASNGALNATFAFLAFVLIRFLQARRDPRLRLRVHGLVLIAVFSSLLLPCFLAVAVSVAQFNTQLGDSLLSRYRQVAVHSASLDVDGLEALARSRRAAGLPLDVRVYDSGGQLLHDSNPVLSATLGSVIGAPAPTPTRQAFLPAAVDLLIPAEGQTAPIMLSRAHLRYSSSLEPASTNAPPASLDQQRAVVLVEPALLSLRQLQLHSTRALALLLALIVLAALLARAAAKSVEKQFPGLPLLVVAGDSSTPAAAGLVAHEAAPGPLPRSWLQELQTLFEALQRRDAILEDLREDLRRSDLQRRRLQSEVDRLSILDPLTGCFNRRELYRRLDHELRLIEREERELSFLCLEIDHLRQIKNSYGKPIAEEVTRRVAMELSSRSRATDFLCRLGPDQFALLLSSCDAASAERVAEMLSSAISAMEIRHDAALLAVTLSIGVTAVQQGRDDPDSLIARAQSALYRAKAEGRNQVVVV